MIVFPNAKINVGLRIVAKRADGYHDIETAFWPVKLSDALEFVLPSEKAESDILQVSGSDTGGAPGDNLVMKAAAKLHEKYYFPYLKIHLHKGIPAGAGLGGGSSDAACLLKAVNRHFSLSIQDEELKIIALQLGSDCPFFIKNVPSIATGRGEVLYEVENFLRGFYIILLNPGVHISTKEAYGHCIPSEPAGSLAELLKTPIIEWRRYIKNDFEEYVFSKYPSVGELKSGLYNEGAVFSLMSGSGSSVFGIFSEKKRLPGNLRKHLVFEGFL